MKKLSLAIRLAVCLLVMLAVPASLQAVDFAHDVMPILKRHCAKCHTGKRKEGGLTLGSRAGVLAGGKTGPAVVPGNSSKGQLLERIRSTDEDLRMPPEGPRVSAKEFTTLKKWIEAGLPWEPGIRLGASNWEPPLKPRRVTLPQVRNGREHPIDRLLDEGLAKGKLPTPGPISDAAFLRRVSLDAVGLLPSPDVLQAFLADPDTQKRQKLIDRLLTDDIAYADHWLTTWNDLLRNDYTGTGFITGGRKQITTWLYAALRGNKPYDQMVRELISPRADSAGFIEGIKWRGEVNASQTRDIQFAQNISQVFLGINMKCASCHDSFIDRWTLTEAYNLAAIYADGPLELNRCDKPMGVMATPKWIFPEIGDVDPKAPKAERLKQLAKLITHPQNGRFTRTLVNRIWDRLMGRGIVHPVDAMHARPWNEDLLDYLSVRFADDGYDLRKLIRFVMTSQAYQSRTVILKAVPGDDYVYTGPIAKRMTAEQLIDSIWQITAANPVNADAKVDRSEAKKLPQTKTESAKTVKPALPAEIVAKWIWHQGAIGRKTQLRTSFTIGAVPATAMMLATCDNAFTMKVNGTKVASSRTWQTPLRFDIAPQLMKGENLIEVAGEMFGGSAGFIGQLAFVEKGKPRVIATDMSWEARSPSGQWQKAKELFAYKGGPWGAVLDRAATSPFAADHLPRPPIRAALVKNDFLMRSLGRPHRDQVVTTRPAELTTLQAIDLANGEILAGYLQSGAKHLVGQGKTGNELIVWLNRFALSREPTSGEREVLLSVVGDGRDPVVVEDLLWLVFMQPEFQIIR